MLAAALDNWIGHAQLSSTAQALLKRSDRAGGQSAAENDMEGFSGTILGVDCSRRLLHH